MSDAITEKITFFDEVVTEYRLKQKEVVKNFVYGCIELGEILCTYRDRLKKEDKWMEFLDVIWLHIAQANQQIRLYELSKEKIEKDLLAGVVTNWEKLNLFLALTDEQKEKVLAKKLDENTTTSDFRTAIAEIKSDDKIEIEDSKFEDQARKKIEEMVGGNPLLVDTKKASKTVQESLGMSIAAREFLEGVLYMEKVKEVLRSDNSKVSGIEKAQLKELYATQLAELEDELDKFFS